MYNKPTNTLQQIGAIESVTEYANSSMSLRAKSRSENQNNEVTRFKITEHGKRVHLTSLSPAHCTYVIVSRNHFDESIRLRHCWYFMKNAILYQKIVALT